MTTDEQLALRQRAIRDLCQGPGISTEVPAKYVYDMMFGASNLGQGFAASTMMLVTVALIVIPWAMLEFGGKKHG